MSAKQRKYACIAIGIFAVIILVVVIKNIKGNTDFWKLNLSNSFSILWSIVVTFLLTQAFGKYQRKTDVILGIIKDLLVVLDESKTCVIVPGNGKEPLLMQKRQISVRITLLKEYAHTFEIENDICFIEKHFREYELFLSDHIEDLEFLSNSYNELARSIKNISDRLYMIMMKV